jgi:hypothetical protein
MIRYSPDHVDALVWALSELMVEPVAGWGLIEWTRLEAEKVTAEQIGNRKPAEPPSLTNGGVAMKNGFGVSTVYGLSGTHYNADADGVFIVATADVRPLLAAGWTLQNNLERLQI